MKDKELELEETEASHTLGGAGEGHVQVRGNWSGCKCYSPVRHLVIAFYFSSSSSSLTF